MEPTEELKYSLVDIDARQVANYSVNRRDPGNNRAKGDRCSHPIFWKRKTSVLKRERSLLVSGKIRTPRRAGYVCAIDDC
jgi:hypothetical protein